MISIKAEIQRFQGWYSKEQLRDRELIIINPIIYDSYEKVGKKCRMKEDNDPKLYAYGQERYEKLCGKLPEDIIRELGARVKVTIGSGIEWNLARGCVMPKEDFDALTEHIRVAATKRAVINDYFDLDNPPEECNYTEVWELFDGEKVRM